MCERRATVVLQWTKHRVRQHLIARARQDFPAIIAAYVKSERHDDALAVRIDRPDGVTFVENAVSDLQVLQIYHVAGHGRSGVIAERAIRDLQCR
jgi:hypothetical protein